MRTLVARRRYFGVDAIDLQRSAYRVLARVVGLPQGRAHVSERQLRRDFGADTCEGPALVTRLVAGGLVKPHPERDGDFEVMPRLAEFASARVVEPLPRAKAKRLVERACRRAESFNQSAARNPFAIHAIATCGEYLTDRTDLSELRIGVVLCRRPADRMTRWRTPLDEADGVAEIRAAIGRLSSFVKLIMTEDARALPRPFSIAWRDPTL